MSDVAELLKRVREAEGSSREIDGDLWWHFDPLSSGRCFNNGATGLPRELDHSKPMPDGLGAFGVRASAPPYTLSIDAAVALVERVRPGKPWMVGVMSSGRLSAVVDGKVALSLPTPALALLAALLASLVEGETQDGK